MSQWCLKNDKLIPNLHTHNATLDGLAFPYIDMSNILFASIHQKIISN